MTVHNTDKQIAYECARKAFVKMRDDGRGLNASIHAAVDAAIPTLAVCAIDDSLTTAYKAGVQSALSLAQEARMEAYTEEQAGLASKSWEDIDRLCNKLSDLLAQEGFLWAIQ